MENRSNIQKRTFRCQTKSRDRISKSGWTAFFCKCLWGNLFRDIEHGGGWRNCRKGGQTDNRGTGAFCVSGRADSCFKRRTEKQVAIADILVMHPEVMILDEPAAALDMKHTKKWMRWSRGWRKRNYGADRNTWYRVCLWMGRWDCAYAWRKSDTPCRDDGNLSGWGSVERSRIGNTDSHSYVSQINREKILSDKEEPPRTWEELESRLTWSEKFEIENIKGNLRKQGNNKINKMRGDVKWKRNSGSQFRNKSYWHDGKDDWRARKGVCKNVWRSCCIQGVYKQYDYKKLKRTANIKVQTVGEALEKWRQMGSKKLSFSRLMWSTG